MSSLIYSLSFCTLGAGNQSELLGLNLPKTILCLLNPLFIAACLSSLYELLLFKALQLKVLVLQIDFRLLKQKSSLDLGALALEFLSQGADLGGCLLGLLTSLGGRLTNAVHICTEASYGLAACDTGLNLCMLAPK